MTRLRTWLTSAWNACVLGVCSAMAAANLPTRPFLSRLRSDLSRSLPPAHELLGPAVAADHDALGELRGEPLGERQEVRLARHELLHLVLLDGVHDQLGAVLGRDREAIDHVDREVLVGAARGARRI